MRSVRKAKLAQAMIRRPRTLVCVGLALATLVAFEGVRLNDSITFDDQSYVYANEWVSSGLTHDSILWAVTTTHRSNWHPLSWLSHMVDVELFGLNAGAHHLTTLVLHIFNTLLLFGLFERMTGRLWPSAFVAALFGWHPLHVEAVAWIAERKEVLSTLLGLLSMWAYVGYVKRGGRGCYLLTALFFAMGLMAKPMLVTLPLVLLLLDYWPLERIQFGGSRSLEDPEPQGRPSLDKFRRPERSIGQLLIEKIPLIALSAISSLVTLLAQGGAMERVGPVSLALRAANAVVSYVRYLGKLFWPTDLSILYPHPNLPGGTPWTEWQVAGAILLLAGVSVAVVLARRRKYLIMGWLWYLGTLVPVIGLVQVGYQAMADRYSYIPLIGVFVMIAWGAADLLSVSRRHARLFVHVAPIFGLAVLAAFIASTRAQVRLWRDSVVVYQHALGVGSASALIENNLGAVLKVRGLVDEAMRHYREALEINPGHYVAHMNLGLAFEAKGQLDEAIHHHRQALRLKRDSALHHSNLADALRSSGRIDEAILHYRQVLQIEPDHVETHNNLGVALASRGDFEGAMHHYREVLRQDPKYANAHYNLGLALGDQGRLDEAARHYRKAVRLDPGYTDALYNLGLASGEQGRLDLAVRYYRETLRADARHADARLNLGVVLATQGELDEAILQYREALRFNRDDVRAYYNLANALVWKGEQDEAIRHYREALRREPDHADAHNNLGVVLGSKDLLDEAILHYREALRANADHADAHINLGVALVSRGEFDEAIRHYREALRVNPTHADAHNNLGNALGARGKLDDAIQHYRQALEARPDHPAARNNLDVALELKGQPAEKQRIAQ